MNEPFKRFISIRSKLLGAFIVVVALPTILVFYRFTAESSQLLEKEVYWANQSLMDQAVSGMNLNAEKMVKMTYMLDAQLYSSYLNKPALWNTADNQDMSTILQIQKSMLSLRDVMLDNYSFVGIVDENGDAVTTLSDFHLEAVGNIRSEPWYKIGVEKKGYPYWLRGYRIPPEWGYVEGAPNKDFLVVSRVLNGVGSVQNYGVVVIGMSMQQFFNVQPQTTAGFSELLVWDGGEYMAHLSGEREIKLAPEQMVELKQHSRTVKRLKLDGNEYLVNIAQIPQIGLSVAALLPIDEFRAQMNRSKNESLVILVLFYMIGLSVFVLLLIRFTKPLHTLIRSIMLVGKGDFKQKVPVIGNDEAAVLGSSFNGMVSRLDELIRHVSEEQRKREESHFQALQAQINPHFLFNTLNSIKLMAMLSNTNRDVSDMITALGKLMEFSMKQHTVFVTLRQELQYLELYMKLQKIRYHDDINISIHVPEELLDCTVLKFTLQPLVENCIIHGAKLPLHIWIEAERERDDLKIRVRDNGQGVSEDKMLRIQSQLKHDDAKYSGLGLLNVDRRIKLHFGSEYGLEVSTPETGGMLITATIPERREE
ncbi:sensor histidine kinase [Paenibacillus pasadenensis]|uniref:sensor histidine kinase n=1 Tax=Paenibacillus pasadenensis TaxID=217090 RepID=UPI0020403882|nr:sensor histidine kinase [Paenibacillus pasadenensis]MCM3747109.1 sensor histidine kinase [Paenibacillus pasadenensis]